MPNVQFYLPIIHESTAVLYNSLNLQNYINYTSEERDALILNYWGNPEDIQIFPIGFRSIEKMFAKSFDQKTIALHVMDIGDKTKIDMEWMPVRTKRMGGIDIYDFALNINEAQHYYFILKKEFYDDATMPNTIATKGMKAATKDSANVIFATIGRTTEGAICAFANAGSLTFINGDEGTGGNGYAAGAKVPAGS